jgi:phage repressor protein C with HTH and peptisase S24 domain
MSTCTHTLHKENWKVLDDHVLTVASNKLKDWIVSEKKFISQQKLAIALGVSRQTIMRWISGDFEALQVGTIRSIAKYRNQTLEETLEWLETGNSQNSPNKKTVETFENITWIPVYDIMASAGNGIMNYPLICQTGFDAQEIASKFGNNHRLEGIKVRGDSMQPTVDDGDIVYINRDDTTPKNGIFVIRIGDEVLIKRLSKLPNKSIKVSSDNEFYPSFEIDLSAENLDFEIIGKVWKKMQDVD